LPEIVSTCDLIKGSRVPALHHAAVHVTDLERAVEFYVTVFGLTVTSRLRLGAEDIVFLDAKGARVELIADGTRGRSTGVVDHFALEVEALDTWLPRLRENGVTLLDEAPIAVPELGARIVFCLGPDGERIELFEKPAS
jgi:catechol 2,3-dioxygenase-like lactoylglutathione lyase family enzyme